MDSTQLIKSERKVAELRNRQTLLSSPPLMWIFSQLSVLDPGLHQSHGWENSVPIELQCSFLWSCLGVTCLCQRCAGWPLSCVNVWVATYQFQHGFFSLVVIGVNSVLVVGSIFSSCGVQESLQLWCDIHLYQQQRGSSLCVMSRGLLSSCVGGFLSRCGAVSFLVVVWVPPQRRSFLLFELVVPH